MLRFHPSSCCWLLSLAWTQSKAESKEDAKDAKESSGGDSKQQDSAGACCRRPVFSLTACWFSDSEPQTWTRLLPELVEEDRKGSSTGGGSDGKSDSKGHRFALAIATCWLSPPSLAARLGRACMVAWTICCITAITPRSTADCACSANSARWKQVRARLYVRCH